MLRLQTYLLYFLFIAVSAGCSNSDPILDVRGPLAIIPTAPTFISYNSIGSQSNLTPWVSWGTATDRSRLGIDSYEISIGSSRCGSDLVGWFNLTTTYGITTSFTAYAFTIPTALVSGSTYFVNIRAKDKFNQSGEVTCGEGFTYVGSELHQEAYIKASNAEANDVFGAVVAIDGETMVVGAPYESSNQNTITNGPGSSSDNSLSKSGAVYVYRKVSGQWQQEAYIKPANPDANDYFGGSISISGDTLAVASKAESSCQTTINNNATVSFDNSCAAAGAVYIYKRIGTTWAQEAYIKASNANANDYFGYKVSLDQDTLVVSATWEDSNLRTITNAATSSSDNTRTNSGAVYVYKRTGTTWAQEAYIKASNADSGDVFGIAVSIHQDTLAVAATYEASSQTTITNGTTAGSSNNSYAASGAVYVYKRTGTTWAQEAYIKAGNAKASDQFGFDISLNGDTLAVGVPYQTSGDKTIINGTGVSNDTSVSNVGAVYVYKRTGTTWAQEAFIKPSNASVGDAFGYSISLKDDQLFVGCPGNDSSSFTIEKGSSAVDNLDKANSGAIFQFTRSSNNWSQTAFIKPYYLVENTYSGFALATDGSSVVVGSENESSDSTNIINGETVDENTSAENAGAAYIYGH